MRAVAIDRFGGPETLTLKDLPAPVPQAGEVLIRIVASGVNPVDWKIREGYLAQRFPHHFPVVLGWECAGIVEATGAGATRFSRGDAVYSYTRLPTVQHGTYAELLALPEASVAKKPASLLFHEAAAVPLAGLTAYQALMREPGITPGSTMLVHAASGGVGHFAVQIAKAAGATVIGTAGKANQDFIKSLGVDHAIDYTAGDFREAVKKIAPDGVDLAFDTVGGDTLAKTYDVVKKGGRLVGVVAVPDAAEGTKRGFAAKYHFVEPSADDLAALGARASGRQGGRLSLRARDPPTSLARPCTAAAARKHAPAQRAARHARGGGRHARALDHGADAHQGVRPVLLAARRGTPAKRAHPMGAPLGGLRRGDAGDHGAGRS
jgi:NADPH2:quinone reductase